MKIGTSLPDQCLGLNAFTTEGMGSIPVPGTKIPQTTAAKGKKKKKISESLKETVIVKIIIILLF